MSPRFVCCDLIRTGYVVGVVGILLSIISCFTFAESLESILQVISQNTNFTQEKIREFHDDAIEEKCIETVVSVSISVLLIIGTAGRYRMLIFPWVVYVGVQLVVYGIAILMALIVSIYLLAKHGAILVLIMWIIYAGIFAIALRIWYAILEFYKFVRESELQNHFDQTVTVTDLNAPMKIAYTGEFKYRFL